MSGGGAGNVTDGSIVIGSVVALSSPDQTS